MQNIISIRQLHQVDSSPKIADVSLNNQTAIGNLITLQSVNDNDQALPIILVAQGNKGAEKR